MFEEKRNKVHYYYFALARDVLVVAFANEAVGDWAAYCGAVSGDNHCVEKFGIARSGDKLPQKLAEFLFPWLAKDYEWRD